MEPQTVMKSVVVEDSVSYSLDPWDLPPIKPRVVIDKTEGRRLQKFLMGINTRNLRDLIINVLTDVGLYSEDTEELLMLTAAVESNLGHYLNQNGGGPARGIFQMEPTTEQDIFDNYLVYNPSLLKKVREYQGLFPEKEMVYNLAYQIIMARIHYLRVPERLPSTDDIEGVADYWKRYYNTYKGKGTVEKAVKKYITYVSD